MESNRKLRIHHLEGHIGAIPGFNPLAGSKRCKDKEENTADMENSSPIKKKNKTETSNTVEETEAMDDNEVSAALGGFVFSKNVINTTKVTNATETQNVKNYSIELSKRQDEKILAKRKIEEEKELKQHRETEN